MIKILLLSFSILLFFSACQRGPSLESKRIDNKVKKMKQCVIDKINNGVDCKGYKCEKSIEDCSNSWDLGCWRGRKDFEDTMKKWKNRTKEKEEFNKTCAINLIKRIQNKLNIEKKQNKLNFSIVQKKCNLSKDKKHNGIKLKLMEYSRNYTSIESKKCILKKIKNKENYISHSKAKLECIVGNNWNWNKKDKDSFRNLLSKWAKQTKDRKNKESKISRQKYLDSLITFEQYLVKNSQFDCIIEDYEKEQECKSKKRSLKRKVKKISDTTHNRLKKECSYNGKLDKIYPVCHKDLRDIWYIQNPWMYSNQPIEVRIVD